MSNLVIIESPSKAPAIKNALGSGYKVLASQGHVRDLPKSTLGVDIENGFAAKYINIRGKGDLIKELKKEAKSAAKVYLATDPDREGEAISWHLATALGIPIEETKRVTFNELNKTCIKNAIKNPRNIDMDLVNSQQARRILDRIVGYKLSPFLWKSVRSGLSAGRVQSVATRIIVDREREIRAFVPEEYWTVDAKLHGKGTKTFLAHYYGTEAGKQELHRKEEADAVLADIAGKAFTVKSVKKAVRTRNPAPPFITSTMQQEAARKLGFQSSRTMKVAQELYEGIHVGSKNGGTHGLITYMRTDSQRVSSEAQDMARSYIAEAFGDAYVPSTPRVYKTKPNAQDAHEAIRPSNLSCDPDSIKQYLTSDQYKLYKLIWSRFLASQMSSAELDTVSADLEAGGRIFRTSGSTVRFPGFMVMYDHSEEDESDASKSARLPELTEGEVHQVEAILPEQHFTEPPARFNEGTLIKFLEEKGIGRPSTFSSIITTILSRGYVEREGKMLRPTPLGETTNQIMEEYFPDVVDYAFTAKMEDDLDNIANGESTVEGVLSQFYGKFEKSIESAEANIGSMDIKVADEQTDVPCEKCGAMLVIKSGRFGKFAACPNYPTCRNTKPVGPDGKVQLVPPEPEKTGIVCELCGAEMLKRKGRYGDFLACSNYPTCKNTKQIAKKIGVKCPDCGGEVVARHGKKRAFFYACENYPKCEFLSWDQPTEEKCPDCGGMLYIRKGKRQLFCKNKACGFKQEMQEPKESTEE